MVDMCKCKGEGCPLKEMCYRYTATADPYWQYWLDYPPYDKETDDCKLFLMDRRLADKPKRRK